MKLTVVLAMSILAFSLPAFANGNVDTIDFWHVYYNKRVIARYNQVDTGRTNYSAQNNRRKSFGYTLS